MSSNTEAGGRKHTNWLNMMYPRLKLSHRLLRQDGIFMCSIGDDEHGNLKKICDDVFGEENFISSISRLMKSGGAKGTFFTPNIDYVLIYAKDKSQAIPFRMAIGQDQIDSYYNKVETAEGSRKGERYGEERLFLPSLDVRPNQRYWTECPDGTFAIPPGKNFPEKLEEGEKVLPTSEDKVWRWTYDTYKEAKDANRIIFKETDTSGLVDENNKQCKYNIYFKLWLKDQQEKGKVPPNFLGKFESRQSSAELKELEIPFDFAKPVNLLRYLIEIVRCEGEDIVLDFFAGSASTAHAVFKRNVETEEHLRWICVQLPEKTPEGSEAEKAGYETISDIGKERARRAAKKLQVEFPNFEGDFGFKVLKLSSSNIRAWSPDAADMEKSLLDHADHLVEGRSEQDVLYELLLKRGVDLTIPIEDRKIAGKTVYSIGFGVLFACLDDKIAKDEIEPVAQGITAWHKELEPASDTQVVFRDSAFADDIAKTNMTAILEQNGIAHVRSL